MQTSGRALRRVVKVGTSMLRGDAERPTAAVIADLAASLNRQQRRGDRHLLVTSGAVGLGCEVLGLAQRPADHGHTPRGAAVLLRWSTPNDTDRWPLRAGDRVVTMPEAPAEYARALYAALHEADATGAAVVVIEQPPATDAWHAIRDRLARAAR